MNYLMAQRIRGGRLLAVSLFILALMAAFVDAQSGAKRPSGPVSAKAQSTAASDEIFKQLLALPAPTPRLPETAPADKSTERPPSFWENPPADDAPTADLIDFWVRRTNSSGQSLTQPSEVVRARLLDACIADPEILNGLLRVLPDNKDATEQIIKLYEASPNDARLDDDWRKTVHDWLKYNSTYYLNDLLRLAAKATDASGDVDQDDALTALAKFDREHAMPLLLADSAGTQPRTAALATVLLYRAAIADQDGAAEEEYRSRLRAIAEDHAAPAYARDKAIQELASTDWTGRDDWFISLFADESLLEPQDNGTSYSPLTALPETDADKWIPALTKLVQSKDPAVRQNAANCLLKSFNSTPRREVLLPVLRWLSDPDWLHINPGYRVWFIQRLSEMEVPESVPGLIWIVENENYNRGWAARTLAHYHDPRAIPVLKWALESEKNVNWRQFLIEGLIASGGVTEAEQVEAVEAYAVMLTTPGGRDEVTRYHADDAEPLSVPVSIGKYLAAEEDAPEALVRGVLARIDSLQRKNPALAQALVEVTHGWHGKLVDLDFVRRIDNGSANAAMITNALQRVVQLRENALLALQSAASSKGTAAGVATVLLADDGLAGKLLGGNDEQAQIALLACARMVQMPLPVVPVGALLTSGSKLLSLAAEKYLLAEDSRDARQLLWSHYPEVGYITGWRENVGQLARDGFSAMDRAEEKLNGEIFAKADAPLAVFALLDNREQPTHVIRVYPGYASYTYYEDDSRYLDRIITVEELSAFRSFISDTNLTDEGPQISACNYNCPVTEFIALNRLAGRRVLGQQGVTGWAEVLARFDLLGQNGAKIHYRLEDQVKGLEVLVAERALTVKGVEQSGKDLRVLVEREETQDEFDQEAATRTADRGNDEITDEELAEHDRQAAEQARARVTWRQFSEGKLGTPVAPPDEIAYYDRNQLEIDDDFPENINSHLALAAVADKVILARVSEDGGLWEKALGQEPVRVSRGGVYGDPVVTPDGQWIVAARADDGWDSPNGIIRLNRKTGQEHPVVLPPADDFSPVASLPGSGQVLLRRARDSDDKSDTGGPAAPEFYLLEAATGKTTLVTGNFEPLLQELSRLLQPTGKPDEVWAAIPDPGKNRTQVGRYSLKDFSFQPVLTVPEIAFDSTNMWVDEAAGKVYIVYSGQLIRLPLTAVPPTPSTPAATAKSEH